MRQLPAGILALVALMTLTPSHAEAEVLPASSASSRITALNQALDGIRTQAAQPLASLVALVIRDGKVVYEYAGGDRYIDAQNPTHTLPADVDTLYRVASVSKMVTAIGAMRMVEQGKLDLDADISRYLAYPVRNPAYPGQALTVRMLLSHLSSLRDSGGYSIPAGQTLRDTLYSTPVPKADGVWAADDGKPQRAPGRYFSYVNLNWGVLGTVMEAASGQRFDLLMQELVFRPLQLNASFSLETLTPAERQHIAVLYRKQKDEQWNAAGPWYAQTDDVYSSPFATRAFLAQYRPGVNATPFSPQGGLRISARGLARIMQMLMNDGEYEGVRLLTADSVHQMMQPQWRYDAHENNGDTYRGLFLEWGLGMQHFSGTRLGDSGDCLTPPLPGYPAGFTAWGHLGFAYGLESGFFLNPQTHEGMIYLIGGVGADPDQHPGRYSGLSVWEEQILTQLSSQL